MIFKRRVRPFPEIKFSQLVESIAQIRSEYAEIALYGSPTGPNWLGIAHATQIIYPKNSLSIPQEYSNCSLSQGQQKELLHELRKAGFSSIIISGFPTYFYSWINELSSTSRIEIVYHGTISEWHDQSNQTYIARLIEYARLKKISALHFIHKPLADVFQELYPFESRSVVFPPIEVPQNFEKLKLDDSKFHIGVLGSDTFNKNLHNQVIHALLIPNTMVHVLDATKFSYLGHSDRIVGHGTELSRIEFLRILGSMDLNLYMSFNESFGLVKAESEALGVPCLCLEEVSYKDQIQSTVKNIIKNTSCQTDKNDEG